MLTDFTGWNPNFVPVAIVWARCANHPAQQLYAWALTGGGSVMSWDETGLHSHEHVADSGTRIPTPRAQKEIRSRGGLFGFSVASTSHGEPGGWRLVLRCPRASCTCQPELNSHSADRITKLLQSIADHTGRGVYSRLDEVPREVIDVDEFLRDPGPTLAKWYTPGP